MINGERGKEGLNRLTWYFVHHVGDSRVTQYGRGAHVAGNVRAEPQHVRSLVKALQPNKNTQVKQKSACGGDSRVLYKHAVLPILHNLLIKGLRVMIIVNFVNFQNLIYMKLYGPLIINKIQKH